MNTSRAFLIALLLSSCSAASSGEADSDQTQPGTDELKIDSFQRISGTPFLYGELDERRQSRAGISSGYSADSPRNLLFYNLDSRSWHWLFPTNNQSVLRIRPLSLSQNWAGESFAGVPNRGEVVAILYEVDRRDTNDEQRHEGSDSFDLGLSDVSGKNYNMLVSDVIDVRGVFWVNDERILIWYGAADALHGLEVNVTTRKVVERIELPMPPTTEDAV